MVNVEKLQSIASAVKTVGDSGAKFYGFIMKAMESVGCPSWLARLGESKEKPAGFSDYVCKHYTNTTHTSAHVNFSRVAQGSRR